LKRTTRRAAVVIDCFLIFLFAAYLVRPLFKAKYLDRWDSIESTFIADGRFLKDHWPHPQWHPLWYCGTRFDYIYPPALRYGTALLSNIWIPVKAYHVYTALFYCIGIAGVYFLVRVLSRSRGAAWLAALASALLSPSFLLLPVIRNDTSVLEPQRLHVLVRYGEGPHMTALALIPFALACAFLALKEKRPAALACAAVMSALVVLNNFYGATALATFYPILVWSIWVTHRDKRVWLRAAAIPALAYGLTAFWLVPSYVRVTMDNMKFVSERGNPCSLVLAIAAAVGFGLATDKWARGKPRLAYPVFLCGAVLFFALNVLGNFYFGFRVTGEPGRLVPELDLVLILAAVEVLRRMWNWRLLARVAAVALVPVSFWPGRSYWLERWTLYPVYPDYRNRIEYRVTDWVARNLPGARVHSAGSVRFWYDTWHDLPEVGGGSEQGIRNPLVLAGMWEIQQGEAPAPAVEWLKALGADAVIVHDKTSQEIYHDFLYPKKFAGVLPVLYDSGAGDVIYRVPRRFPGLARVVEKAKLDSLRPLALEADLDVRPYAETVEQGPELPASTRWEGTDAMRIHAHLDAGEALVVQVSHDPAWHAYANGTELPIRRDPIGFMRIDAPPGEQDIRLVFERPLENTVGGVLSVASLIAVGFLFLRRRTVSP